MKLHKSDVDTSLRLETRFLGARQKVSWLFMMIIVAVCGVWTLLINVWVLQGKLKLFFALFSLTGATGGLVNLELIVSALFLLPVGLATCTFGRLRLTGVGWVKADIIPGILTTAGLWFGIQVALAVFVIVLGGSIVIDYTWSQFGFKTMLGGFIGQACGVALLEETLFRGFLVPQFFLRLRSLAPKAALTIAILGSTVIFTLFHIPSYIFVGHLVGTDLIINLVEWGFLFGLLFSVVYIFTRNLFMVVGFHALVNAPTQLIQASYHLLFLSFSLVILVGLILALFRRKRLSAGLKPSFEST